MRPTKPNFFIVGAPKCGTTSLYEHLRRHPQVFMPYSDTKYWRHKEPYFFCEELIKWEGLRVDTESEYAALFSEASSEKCIGEATSLYLYSESAASRIKAYSQDAKIIILLRDPIEMMISWHHDCVKWGHENVLGFQDAVLLEKKRETGSNMPPGSGYPYCLLYNKIAAFSSQVERYFGVFGRDAVKVCLLSDFKTDPQNTISEIEDFLAITRSHSSGFDQFNKRKSVTQGDAVKTKLKSFFREYGAWTKGIRPLVPPVLKKLFNESLLLLNKPIEKDTVDPAFIELLRTRMVPDILALEHLINRDLSAWRHSAKAPAYT